MATAICAHCGKAHEVQSQEAADAPDWPLGYSPRLCDARWRAEPPRYADYFNQRRAADQERRLVAASITLPQSCQP